MRIRHVLPQPAMGNLPADPSHAALTGIVGAAWSLAVQQVADGHEVEVVAPGQNGYEHQTIAGVRVYWLPQWSSLRSRRRDLSYLVPLWLYTLGSRAVEVTHVHGNPYYLVPFRSRARVLHVQDSSIQSSPRMEQAMARADRIICCSQFIRHQLMERVAYPAAQIDIVPNGADWNLYAQTSREEARAALDIPSDDLALLYVGRIGPEKGLLVLVEALGAIVARGRSAPLLLVAGSGTLGFEGYPAAWSELQSYEHRVRQLAEDLPVRFLGAVPRTELPACYRAADIFVCPSTYQEPFGMVNIEAAAAGLPVVASAVGGIPEAVFNEQTGLLFPSGDGQALADALLRLMDDAPLRDRMGRAGRNLGAQFDWKVIAGTVADIYRRALRLPPQIDTPPVGRDSRP